MNIYEKAIWKWGKEAQILMMLEEMSELSFLLFKVLRNQKDKIPDNWQISEEIADVEIMIEQMKYLFHNREEINTMRIKKLQRLAGRLS